MQGADAGLDSRVHLASLELCGWSGRRDSNPRPSGPKPDALPGCATPRLNVGYRNCDGFL